jgi:CheY-like chemotaxis protein
MPVMNGWEFIKSLRQDDRFRRLPTIVLTAKDSDDARQRAREAGFNRFEAKGNREGFLDQVARLLLPPGSGGEV